jgi:tight adherence protein B
MISRELLAIVAAAAAGTGVHLLVRPRIARVRSSRSPMTEWLRQSGVDGVSPVEFVVVELAVLAATTAVLMVLFGAIVPAFAAGVGAMAAPLATYRNRRAQLTEVARSEWPAILEELRLQVGTLGRSVPAALMDVGRRAPTEPMRLAFEAAHREWLLSTDFTRVVRMLQDRLADPTADTVLETLLVASEIGGTDIDQRLARLLTDRQVDLRHRHEARSRQSGVRFARWFVLIVPFAMALVGLGIGDGRAAYREPSGQVVAGLAVAFVVGCWWWSAVILRLPEQRRIARATGVGQ